MRAGDFVMGWSRRGEAFGTIIHELRDADWRNEWIGETGSDTHVLDVIEKRTIDAGLVDLQECAAFSALLQTGKVSQAYAYADRVGNKPWHRVSKVFTRNRPYWWIPAVARQIWIEYVTFIINRFCRLGDRIDKYVRKKNRPYYVALQLPIRHKALYVMLCGLAGAILFSVVALTVVLGAFVAMDGWRRVRRGLAHAVV